MFPFKKFLKHGDAVSPLLFNFASEFNISRVQVNQDGLKLNDKHQLLFYADNIDMLGRIVYTIKDNTGALVVASKDIGLDVVAYQTKYFAMSQNVPAGRGHNMKTNNNTFFERAVEIK
jgi:hypothetical protein